MAARTGVAWGAGGKDSCAGPQAADSKRRENEYINKIIFSAQPLYIIEPNDRYLNEWFWFF
jgi:hypothetical protein